MTPAIPTEVTPRDRFKKAHHQWHEAEQRMAQAVAAANAGTEALQACQAEVAGLDAAAAHHAEYCIAAGLQSNGLDVEHHLQQQARASFALDQAKRRLGLLVREREQIATELGQAQVRMILALETTLAAEAEKLAGEVQEIEQYSREVRHSLAGLSRYWLAASEQRPIKLGRTAMQVLTNQSVRDAEPQIAGRSGGPQDPIQRAQEYWRRVGQALLQNPDANIEDVA
jgi:hypothetical protein